MRFLLSHLRNGNIAPGTIALFNGGSICIFPRLASGAVKQAQLRVPLQLIDDLRRYMVLFDSVRVTWQ